MASSQLAYQVEKAIGHQETDTPGNTQQDVSNYSKPGLGKEDQSMIALTWQGKNDVKMR